MEQQKKKVLGGEKGHTFFGTIIVHLRKFLRAVRLGSFVPWLNSVEKRRKGIGPN